MKKSQAALEFLTTYAWAFLVILIMVGALAYFGILRPNKLLPDRCNLGPEFACLDYTLRYSSQQVNLRLQNNAGEAIIVDSLSVLNDAGGSLCTNANDVPHPPGNVTDYQITGCDFAAAGYSNGEKGKVDLLLTYYTVKSGSGFPHSVHGEIFASFS